jgi:HAD superfamily hydrolase (TIGR01509 family)
LGEATRFDQLLPVRVKRLVDQLGVVFDWDGVVVDSAPQHEASWECLAAEEGLDLPHAHFQRGFGRRNHYIIPQVLGWTHDPGEIERLSRRKEVLYRECLHATKITPLPGVRMLLENLRSCGVTCAVGSSTERRNVEMVLELLRLNGLFAALVTAEDVTRGKPDPEVFIKAARAIQREPEHCVVIEDTEPGLQAARRAGMYALAVATTHQEADLPSADRVVADLVGVSAAELRRWLRSRSVP